MAVRVGRATNRLAVFVAALAMFAIGIVLGARPARGANGANDAPAVVKTPGDVAGSPGAAAAPGPAIVESDGERYITMDFQDVDIAVLVKFIGEITGKNFVMDERVQGKVTVVSPTRITPEEAYQVFQAVLQVKGFTTVPSGAAVRIIPTKDAKATSLRTLEPGGHAPTYSLGGSFAPLSWLWIDGEATLGAETGRRGWGVAGRVGF